MVVVINLMENTLHGQLPTELGLLSNLQELDFGNNQISGLIPSELGRLTTLEYFEIGKFAIVPVRSWIQSYCWALSYN